MRNKFFKLGAVLLVVFQLVSMTAFASITSPGGSDYYWYEDFNSGIASMKKSSAGITAEEYQIDDSNKAVRLTTTANGKMGYIPLGKLDFSKPIVISYDVMTTASTVLYGTLAYYDTAAKTDINLAFLPRFDNSYIIQGYAKKAAVTTDYAVNGNDVWNKPSSSKYAANNWNSVQSALIYDSTTQILTVKQYIDGKPLKDADGNVIEYKMKRNNMADAMASNMTLRFNFGSGKSAVIDNVMIRQEGSIDLNNGGWIQDGNTTIPFTDTASYAEDALKDKYSLASDTITSKDDFELTRYDKGDELLLNGTTVEAKSSFTAGANSISLYGLPRDNDKHFLIFKLKDTKKVTSFSGTPVKSPYALLHSGTTTIVRETHLYDADGTELKSENGMLPQETAKIVITLSYKDYVNVDAKDVKITSGYYNVKSTKSDNVYTIDLSSNPLSPAEQYTISAGSVSEKLTTTGTKPANPYATAHLQTFDNGVPFTNSNSEITLTNENGRILYKNSLGASDDTKYVTYNFGEKFDFTKGSMLVSFDVTLNQKIEYLGKGSYYLSPAMYLGDKPIGYMPAIEVTGVRARKEDGGRVAVTDSKNNMAVGDTVTISTLFTYYPDKNKIRYIQFADGKRLYNNTKEIIPEYFIGSVDSFIQSNASMRLYGRNFNGGGLYIDNLMMTTVDGITADDVLSVVNKTAAVNVKSTVAFADGTDVALTNPIFTNNAGKDDFSIDKYAKDDKLRLKGTLTNDVTYDKGTFTFGNLDETYDYVVKLNNASKVKCINGKAIDNVYFTTAGKSVLKTTVLDASGNELTVDSAGKVPSNAAKIKIRFTKDNDDITDVFIDSRKATLEDGEYVFDFVSAPLDANTNYDLKVNNKTYGSFETTDGAMTVSTPVISNDGKTSVFIQNTTTGTPDVYIISATYDSNGAMFDVVYAMFTVKEGNNTYELLSIPNRGTGAVTQKAFVWDGFAELNPYCAETSATISGN